MRNKIKTFLLLLPILTVLLTGNGNASEKISMAVLDLKANNVPAVTASTVSDFLRLELLNTGRFLVMDRGNMDKILQEQAFQQAGCTETDCAVKIGQILNINNIVVGSVNKLGNKFTVIINLIDVEKAEVVQGNSIEAESEEALGDAVKILAANFSSKVPVVGKILRVKENEVVVNIGNVDRVTPGMKLKVQRYGEEIKDDQGRVVMHEKETVGEIELTEVEKDASKANITSQNKPLEKGDLIMVVAAPVVIPPRANIVAPQAPAGAYVAAGPEKKSQFSVVWRSALLPGWGQIYSGRVFKGICIAVAQGILVAGAFINEADYKKNYDEYQNMTDPNNLDFHNMDNTFNKAQKAANSAAGFTIVSTCLWALNILDAWLLCKYDDSTAMVPQEREQGIACKIHETGKMEIAYRWNF